jgi:hypothetical protein
MGRIANLGLPIGISPNTGKPGAPHHFVTVTILRIFGGEKSGPAVWLL